MSEEQPRKPEQAEAEARSAPSGKVVHEAIMKEGEEELRRPSAALFWSGLAAGLSMGFSMIAEGLLHAHLPETPWRPLVSKLGYSVGFLIVILTYVVGLGHFSHVIAGAVEVFALAAAGQATWASALGGYVLPALVGNVLGGVTLVATLNHAQVVAGGEDV